MATPRQELIKMAATRLRVWRNKRVGFVGPSGYLIYPRAEFAIEAIMDECKACPPNSTGAAMLSYYKHASELALSRLDYAVDAEAGECPPYRAENFSPLVCGALR